MFPGKLDCTRSTPHRRGRAAYNLLCVLLFYLSAASLAQSFSPLSHRYGTSASPQLADAGYYPEVAWLGQSTYCNPYFGFRLVLPRELKPEPIYLSVQPSGRHMLLALHLHRLDRSADLFLSAFEDSSADSARRAAKSRMQQAHSAGLSGSGPHKLNLHQRPFFRLHILNTSDPGDESSYYFTQRGYVLHAAIFSPQESLAAAISSAIEHLEFFDPDPDACTSATDASATGSAALPQASATGSAALPQASATGSAALPAMPTPSHTNPPSMASH